MQAESDPNVLYGGDLIESTGPLSDEYPSLGDLILSDLKLGENKTSFVSLLSSQFDQRLNLLNNFYFPRSMALPTRFGLFAIFSITAFCFQKLCMVPA
jgi:hypothetical protein